jgi:MtrB/PioB family decaheme-associated outer membrane protein
MSLVPIRHTRIAIVAANALAAALPTALSATLPALLAAVLAAPAAHAGTAHPDTSAWTCRLCPFYKGASATVEGGIATAQGANAGFGRYTGIDRNGGYLEVGAHGAWRTRNGEYGSFNLERAGLPSRRARLTEGREGRYELRISYQGQPFRQHDDTVTPFRSVGTGTLVLPASWVSAGTTAGMTALSSSLEGVRIESDRRTLALSGKYFASSVWTMFGKFSHTEEAGTELTGASFLLQAVQLPEPVDRHTDTLEAGALWAGREASLRLAYTGSWFREDIDQLYFQNPYLSVVPQSIAGLLALPPDNALQQVSASGEVRLPFWSGALSYLASDGQLSQQGSFVPGSTLASDPVLLPGSLGGDVDLSHYALALALTPAGRLSLRGRATYDGRDDHTSPLAIAYVVTDALPGGTYVTPRYGDDRTRLEGSADYRLFRWARAGIGGDYTRTHYSPDQVLSSLLNRSVWGYGTLTPLAALSLTVKGGSDTRDASAFQTTALPLDENPLLRAFDYAPRDREFLSVRATWLMSATISATIEGTGATDAYRLTLLGLRESRERELSTTLTWAPPKPWSLYVDGSYQHLESLLAGLETAGAAVWQERMGQYFWTAGGGGRLALAERWHLELDYQRADSRSDTLLLPGYAAEPFPEDRTGLDTIKLVTTYAWSPALSLALRYERSRYGTSDWALQNVSPDTIPTLLALGAAPYRYAVDLVGVSFVYRLGK